MPLVVVIDSDPVRARSIEALVREETRHEARSVSQGEALELAAERPVDGLITTADALDLAKSLRSQDPELVILLALRPTDVAAREAALAIVGAAGIIDLPIEKSDLIGRLNAALEHRGLALKLGQIRGQLQHAEGALRASNRHSERTARELALTHSELETATERLVEAEELAAVGRVVTGIAHEISTQLALVGYAEAIKARVTDPELVEFADIIVHAQKRLAATVDEICDFALGPRQIEREAADVVSAVDEALAIVRYDPGVRARNIEFRANARPLARIHRQKFSQVIINLVSNAVLATGPGDTLVVEIGTDDETGDAIVSVGDRGVGMTAATLERLGEPFFTTRGDRGSGLGVGICKRIAENHGGALTFESELGVGTTATFRLPIFDPPTEVG